MDSTTSMDSIQIIQTIHKEALLAHRKQQSEDTSTLLGGQSPRKLVDDGKYILLMATGTEVTETSEQENPQSCQNAIRTALSENRGEPKPVIVVGSAGVGKTTALEKLIVDWATGKHLQHFSCVFKFTFSDLNFQKGAMSLKELLLQAHSHLFPESLALVLQKPQSLLFLFDGLDQYQNNLDLPTTLTLCSDPNQPSPVPVLISNLVHGTLLPGAATLLTSRPTTTRLESLDGHQVELLGFLKPQRNAYFNSFFSDPSAASRAIQNMERTWGFYEFWASPNFCWTTCFIYKSLMEAGERLPETLTQLFVCITAHLIRVLSLDKDHARELMSSLGRMASHCCLAPRSHCSTVEMTSFGLQRFLATPTSLKDFLHIDSDSETKDCTFSFHTQMIQEFIMAVSFYLEKSEAVKVEDMLEKHKGCVEFLDLYLVGLSEPSQSKPLESHLGELSADRILYFSSWFKGTAEKVLQGMEKERHLHYLGLLHQSQNEKLVKDTMRSARGISYGGLSVQNCVVLNYILTCTEEWDTLNLWCCKDLTEEKASILVPVMSLSRVISLGQSSLTAGAIDHLALALRQGRTIELNMSYNHMGDTGFKLLCTGLGDCRIEILKLPVCNLTDACCEDLVAVLTTGSSHLRELNLRGNSLRDPGLIKLSKALGSPHCKLQELQIEMCGLTAGSMEAFSTALSSGQSQLRTLDLGKNQITDHGVDWLVKALQHACCQLQSLILYDNNLTATCCAGLAAALHSECCRLTELDLSVNELGQEGALQLLKAISKSGHPLEILSLGGCDLNTPVFKEFGVLLSSGTSRLKSLSLRVNKVGDEGAKHLWAAVGDRRCRLEHLDVEMIQMTDASIGDLCKALTASGSLKSLILKNNLLTDTSVPALVRVTQDSPTIKEMNLQYNNFSEDVFELMDQCEKIRY